MIRVEVIKDFTLKDFDKLKNIKRKMVEKEGKLYVGDTFECDKQMHDYLTGGNDSKAVVVKVVEIDPETVEDYDIDDFEIEQLWKKEEKQNKKLTQKKKSKN